MGQSSNGRSGAKTFGLILMGLALAAFGVAAWDVHKKHEDSKRQALIVAGDSA